MITRFLKAYFGVSVLAILGFCYYLGSVLLDPHSDAPAKPINWLTVGFTIGFGLLVASLIAVVEFLKHVDD